MAYIMKNYTIHCFHDIIDSKLTLAGIILRLISRKKISFLIIYNYILGHRFIFQNVMREMSIPSYQMFSCAHDSKIVHIKNANHN